MSLFRASQRQRLDPDCSFEKTVQNRALPPYDLNSFMDYLYYVERRPESLQFFLWYCDYVERWIHLPGHQRRLAPAWVPEMDQTDETDQTDQTEKDPQPQNHVPQPPRAAALPPSRHTRLPSASLPYVSVSIHRPSDSDKLRRILAILEADSSSPLPSPTTPPSSSSFSSSSSSASAPPPPLPFRHEVSQISHHYLAATAPRALPDADFFAPERAACLRAATHTTHPSALLPAFLAVESTLRTQSFPAFARRWSLANAYGGRLVLGRVLAALVFCCGLALDLLLLLRLAPSPSVRPARLVCGLLWWPALASLLASVRHGIDPVLHVQRRRMLRPWEMDDSGESDENNESGERSSARQEQTKTRKPSVDSVSTVSTVSTVSSRLDPLRKPSMQTLGPRNDPDAEPWAIRAANRSIWRRWLANLRPSSPTQPRTAALQDPTVRLLQDRAVLSAVLWSFLPTAVLVGVSLAIPTPLK